MLLKCTDFICKKKMTRKCTFLKLLLVVLYINIYVIISNSENEMTWQWHFWERYLHTLQCSMAFSLYTELEQFKKARDDVDGDSTPVYPSLSLSNDFHTVARHRIVSVSGELINIISNIINWFEPYQALLWLLFIVSALEKE